MRNPYIEDDEDDPRQRQLEVDALQSLLGGRAGRTAAAPGTPPWGTPSPDPGPTPSPTPAPGPWSDAPPPTGGGGVTCIDLPPPSGQPPPGSPGTPVPKPPRVPGAPVSPTTPRAAAAGTEKRDPWSGKTSVTARGDFGRLEGFDANNFNDDGMQTAKYQAGRIFSRYDPDDPNVLAAVMADPEFKAAFPNAKAVGPDKIDFGDGKPVDVIRGHGAPGAKFAWQTQDDGSATAGDAAAVDAGLPAPPSLGPTGGAGGTSNPYLGGGSANDFLAKLLAEIEALQTGGVSGLERDALRRQVS